MMTPSTTWRSRRERLFRRGDVADRDRDVGAQRRLLAVLLLGLVAIEFVGAQPHARGNRGRLLRRHGAVRQFGDDGHGFAAGVAACRPGTPPNLRKSFSLRSDGLAGADHDQALSLDSLRRQNIQRRAALALELAGGRRPLDQIGRRPQRLAGRRRRTSAYRRKTPPECRGGGGKRDEADLDGVGHRQILQNSGCCEPEQTATGTVRVGRRIDVGPTWSGHYGPPARRCQAPPWPRGHIE